MNTDSTISLTFVRDRVKAFYDIVDTKKDAFIEAGNGFGRTFNYWFPMRIDFVLTSPDLKINQFKTFDKKFSDHFPILARLNW